MTRDPAKFNKELQEYSVLKEAGLTHAEIEKIKAHAGKAFEELFGKVANENKQIEKEAK